MSEKRMCEWARTATLEDKYDVVMQLAALATSNKPVGDDPASVWVSNEGMVRVDATGAPNLAWQAPEVIEAAKTSTDASPRGVEQRLYTVALLSYTLLTGKDYYAGNGIDVVTLGTYVRRRVSVMRKEHLAGIAPVADALLKWTSVKPDKRMEGMESLFRNLPQHVPGTVRLVYVDGNRTQVHVETHPVTGIVSVAAGETVTTDTGAYRVQGSYSFPYRPGTHSYTVTVEKVQTVRPGKVIYIPKSFQTGRQQDSRELVSFLDVRGGSALESITLKMSYPDFVFTVVQYGADGRSTNLGTVKIPKPLGFGGSEYTLTLMFDAEYHKLYARLDDPAGHPLGGRDLGSI